MFLTLCTAYGQGLACASLAALTLDVAFRETDLKDLSQNYFKKMKWRLFIAWNMPKALDQIYSNTTPKNSNFVLAQFRVSILNVHLYCVVIYVIYFYFNLINGVALPMLFKGACHSEIVLKKALGLLSMCGSPLELVDPRVLWGIVKSLF